MQVKFTTFLLVLVFVSSCSSSKNESEDLLYGSKSFSDGLIGGVIPKWFETAKRFTLEDTKMATAKNFFWDVAPDINSRNMTLNVVVETPEGSDYIYKIDMVSGQHYVDKKVCEIKDIWGRYSRSIEAPPMTLGIVPRVLDETGFPQKVMIFGSKDYYNNFWESNFFEVKVVGAVIEKECFSRVCRDHHGWKPRSVLVAVEKNNKDYEGVSSLSELKSKVDWDHVRAFMENMQGVDLLNDDFYPSYKWEKEVGPQVAFDLIKNKSLVIGIKRMKSLKASCYKLYDHWWSKIRETYTVKENGKEVLRQVSFHKVFAELYRQFSDKFYTCSRFVKASNIQDSVERHWFFTYLDIFHKLSYNGYEYSCQKKAWVFNPKQSNGEMIVPPEKQLSGCDDNRLMYSFDSAIQYLKSMKLKQLKAFRYIDYDRHSHGTHNKMYSWVRDDNRVLKCIDDDVYYKKSLEVFPEDLRWNSDWVSLKMDNMKTKGVIR